MGAKGRVGYLVSWFPAITETFILEEVLALRARGVAVDVFPLFGARGGEVHDGWRAAEACTHYHASLSWELVAAQLHWLRRRPRAYLDPQVRAGISVFGILDRAEVDRMVERLRADLDSGEWERRNADLLGLEELDLGYRLVVADLTT